MLGVAVSAAVVLAKSTASVTVVLTAFLVENKHKKVLQEELYFLALCLLLLSECSQLT